MDLSDRRRRFDAAASRALARRARLQGTREQSRSDASLTTRARRRPRAPAPIAERRLAARRRWRAAGATPPCERPAGGCDADRVVRSSVSGAARLHRRIRRRFSGSRGSAAVLARPGRGHRRVAGGDDLRAGGRGAAGGELADRGVVVASGLARGVDSAAHRGCLDAGGATVAVLGSGLDIIYPRRARDAGRRRLPIMGFGQRARARRAAAAGALSAPEPDHQRDLAGGRRRRSLREERLADHRPVRAGAGAGRHGGARQRPQRPQPRLARPSEGWGKGRRDCGRYS